MGPPVVKQGGALCAGLLDWCPGATSQKGCCYNDLEDFHLRACTCGGRSSVLDGHSGVQGHDVDNFGLLLAVQHDVLRVQLSFKRERQVSYLFDNHGLDGMLTACVPARAGVTGTEGHQDVDFSDAVGLGCARLGGHAFFDHVTDDLNFHATNLSSS